MLRLACAPRVSSSSAQCTWPPSQVSSSGVAASEVSASTGVCACTRAAGNGRAAPVSVELRGWASSTRLAVPGRPLHRPLPGRVPLGSMASDQPPSPAWHCVRGPAAAADAEDPPHTHTHPQTTPPHLAQQQVEHCAPPARRRRVQRQEASSVGRSRVGAAAQQLLQDADVAARGGGVRGRGARGVGGGGQRWLPFQQQLHTVNVACRGGGTGDAQCDVRNAMCAMQR